MANFQETRWSDASFSKNYLDNSAGFIPDRQRMLDLMAYLAGCCFPAQAEIRSLDLGCGDGILTTRLLLAFPRLRAVLVDGSTEMLEVARARLSTSAAACTFVRSSFQELRTKDPLQGSFDLVVSSLAIHHLDTPGKDALYRYLFDHLSPGGRLINSDVVLSPSPALEREYLELWREWIRSTSPENPSLHQVPDQYKTNTDNQPDTLAAQLEMLRRAGFRDIDCQAKFGIFAVFGGRKPA